MLVIFAGAVVGGGKPGPGVGKGEPATWNESGWEGVSLLGALGMMVVGLGLGLAEGIKRGGRRKEGGGEPFSESRTAVAHK